MKEKVSFRLGRNEEMGHATHTSKLKVILCACVSLFLIHCGGADVPYTISSPSNSDADSTLQNPTPSDSTLSGCAIPFTSNLVLQTKGGPGLGEIKSDPRTVNPIPIRFGGSQAALYAKEFPTIDLVIEGAPAAMRIQQKDGSSAQGTYDVGSGKIEIGNVIFIVTLLDKTNLTPMGLAPIEMSPLTLTTESVSQSGKFGDIQIKGSALDPASKKLTLVGGLSVPDSFPSDDLKGASLVVSFEGSLSDLPSSGNCSGSFSSGVGFKKVEKTASGEIERDLSDNTLGFERVYVPQSGTDTVVLGDTHFFSKKTLRVKNNSEKALSGNIQSTENFKITPQGNVSIEVGASKDFVIEFSAKATADYSEQAVPVTKTISTSLSFGEGSVKLEGDLRRASSELVVVGTEDNSPSSIDLGIVPAAVLGSGANAKLDCRPLPGKKIAIVSRKVSVENHGIRPLEIFHINSAVDTVKQAKDAQCAGFPNEFLRMALAIEGSAQCVTVQQGGKTYLTDQCKLPDSNGKINFKVIYFPVNASSLVNAVNGKPTPDTGAMTIASSDPLYDSTKGKEDFKLNLSSGVSPDQSDALRIQKEGSETKVSSGGIVRLNIPNANDANISQKIILLNYLDQKLGNVKITVEDPAHFELTQIPTEIPAMAGGATEPAKAEFVVKFTKTQGMTQGDLATNLTIKFSPESTGTENTFSASLIGSVNHKIFTGNVRMQFDYISSYFDTNLLKSASIESEDFRTGKFDNFRPGDLLLSFSAVPGQESIRHVTMIHNLNVEPYNPNLMETILSLSIEDRKKVLRVSSTRLSGYPGGVEDGNHDGIPDCVEPINLHSPFTASGCSFFYYVFGTKPGQDGIYNDETGELFFPDVKLKLIEPYHATVLDYDSTQRTNTELKASIATLTFDGLQAGGNPLVVDPRLSSSDVAVPDDLAKSLLSSTDHQCPAGWVPWDASKKPTFTCFMKPSSPYYLKGFPARPLPNGESSVVISMMTKLNPAGAPDYVPSFMANGRMWVALLGRLIQD